MKRDAAFDKFMNRVWNAPTLRGIDDSISRGHCGVAMQSGLEGRRLPNLGSLGSDELFAVNSVYEAARNLRASFGMFDQL